MMIPPTTTTTGTGIESREGPLDILLVHDDLPASLRLRWMLRSQFGDRVTLGECRAGEEALTVLRQRPADVALIDAWLPDMQGLEVVARIADSGTPTAAVLMTARGNERAAAEALKHGAVDYCIREDVDGPHLERTVRQAAATYRLRQEGDRMAQQLRRTQSQMDHFLRAISHDMGANFMLLDSSFRQMKRSIQAHSPLPAAIEAASHVEACLRESKRFLEDLSQLSSTSGVSMEPRRVELENLADEVLFEQQSLLAERGIQATVVRPLPAVRVNPTRARQVLTNLVRNAARHGCDRRGPRIEIKAVPSPTGQSGAPPEAADMVWLCVADNGPGIPADFREEVFLPGTRLREATAEGSGMGLAIVKRIIDHYGGSIFVADGPGTAFVFSLPLDTSSADAGKSPT
jgi:signal transduction histidine kinase